MACAILSSRGLVLKTQDGLWQLQDWSICQILDLGDLVLGQSIDHRVDPFTDVRESRRFDDAVAQNQSQTLSKYQWLLRYVTDCRKVDITGPYGSFTTHRLLEVDHEPNRMRLGEFVQLPP